MQSDKQTFKVSRHTHPNKLAAAIINAVRSGGVDCFAVGGKAADNLLYALCIVGNVLKDGYFCRFYFSDAEKSDKLKVKVEVEEVG